jgi:hypothetical protein
MPGDGVEYIREQFGIEMTRQQFSVAKTEEKRRAGKLGDGRRKPGRRQGPKPTAAAGPSSHGTSAPTPGTPRPVPAGSTNLVDHVEAIKRAVASLGAEQVRRIVGLFE